MEILTHRQRQEWQSNIDSRWVRTGCNNIWDAIFVAFREYRDVSPDLQQEIILTRTKVQPLNSSNFIKRLAEKLYEDNDDNETRKIYCKLLPKKTFYSELEPYLLQFLSKNDDRTALRNEIIEKSIMLCEYRYEKKKSSWEQELDISEIVNNVLTSIFSDMELNHVSYNEIQIGCKHMEYHVIIITPSEKVLFDSRTWGKGIPDSEYNDVIIVLAHPDGHYDSIGRLSPTKDGNQKISRLFHYDDEAVYFLRKTI